MKSNKAVPADDILKEIQTEVQTAQPPIIL